MIENLQKILKGKLKYLVPFVAHNANLMSHWQMYKPSFDI